MDDSVKNLIVGAVGVEVILVVAVVIVLLGLGAPFAENCKVRTRLIGARTGDARNLVARRGRHRAVKRNKNLCENWSRKQHRMRLIGKGGEQQSAATSSPDTSNGLRCHACNGDEFLGGASWSCVVRWSWSPSCAPSFGRFRSAAWTCAAVCESVVGAAVGACVVGAAVGKSVVGAAV